MTFKTILVNLNHEARVTQLIQVAAAIARPNEAHVVGLYVMPPLFMPSDVVLPMGSEFYEQQISGHLAQAERIKTVFERQTSGEPFVAEWRVSGDVRSAYESISDGVVGQSRTAEIIVVSQATDGNSPPMLTDVAQRVALESGRPVLVVPIAWDARKFGDTITIAWNDSREAARAAFDALPFLRNAKAVRLLTAADGADAANASTIPGAEIAATLARHGINVEVSTIAGAKRSAGPSLLSRCVADGTDMLVMGAYGHSRMREFILGGATRDVLKNMTVPVFMSH